MKSKFFGIIIAVLNLLVVLDIILTLAIFGAGNILSAVFPLILGTAIYGGVLLFSEKKLSVWWGITVISVCKTVFTILPEVFIDFLINGYNYATHGWEFLFALFFIILMFALLTAELAYSIVNIVSIYKKAESN